MRSYLKELRTKNNFTQQGTAKALGISQNYYSCIENGKRQQKMELLFLLKLSRLYGLDVNYLVKKELEFIQVKRGA